MQNNIRKKLLLEAFESNREVNDGELDEDVMNILWVGKFRCEEEFKLRIVVTCGREGAS